MLKRTLLPLHAWLTYATMHLNLHQEKWFVSWKKNDLDVENVLLKVHSHFGISACRTAQ